MSWSPVRAALLAALVALLVNGGALANGFAYDDEVVVLGDETIHTLSGISERLLEPYWPSTYGADVGSWRPLTTGLFAVTWVASGGSPLAFHLVDLLLHGAVTALVVLLLACLAPVGVALLGGLFFAVHPVHVEAVANVVGTAEPLSALFALAAALLFLRGSEHIAPARAVGIALLFALAVLSKEGAVVLPGLLFVLDAARRELDFSRAGAWFRARGWVLGLLAVVLAGLLYARWSVMGAVASPVHAPGAAALAEMPRIFTLSTVWLHWVRLLLVPADLASDYGTRVIPLQYGWSLAGVVGVMVALTALGGAWVAWRRGGPLGRGGSSPRLVTLALLWVVVALLPVANVFFLAPVLLAERTLYLASVGAAAGLAWAAFALTERRGMEGATLVGILLLAGAARSITRIPTWKDSETVAETLMNEHPEAGRAWASLARDLGAKGEASAALKAWAVALGLQNSEHGLSVEVGSYLMNLGRTSSARFFLERAWRERPDWYSAPGLLAALELNAGNTARAEAAARAAAGLAPDNPSMHYLLAQALHAQGRYEEAAAERRRALALGYADRWRSWLRLSNDLALAGDTVAARRALDSARVRALQVDDTAAYAALGAAARALRLSFQPPTPDRP
ncbi:MAG: tetratricopeptide repeat protein [Gemmatimonadota bacterium]